MMDWILSQYSAIQNWMMQFVVIPLLYAVDGMSYAEDSVDGVDWFLLGLLQVLVIALILVPLEKMKPADGTPLDKSAHQSRWVDIFYTLIHRLGLFKFILFLLFADWFFYLDGQLHDLGFDRLNVESWWPGVSSIPWVSFVVYMVVLDFAEYVYHRASHRWNWWWQLHALHHSQRHMSVWTDNRNHILDDLGHSAVFALVALIIGVEPIQYLWLLAISQLIQSWQHGNFDFDHGIFKYILISPRYHRLHHAIGLGYEVPGKPGVLGGCNFGILFPWWDMLFGTAIFTKDTHPTGVRGLEVSLNPFTQQWQGLLHALKALFR